jgi:hypothetical protein
MIQPDSQDNPGMGTQHPTHGRVALVSHVMITSSHGVPSNKQGRLLRIKQHKKSPPEAGLSTSTGKNPA